MAWYNFFNDLLIRYNGIAKVIVDGHIHEIKPDDVIKLRNTGFDVNEVERYSDWIREYDELFNVRKLKYQELQRASLIGKNRDDLLKDIRRDWKNLDQRFSKTLMRTQQMPDGEELEQLGKKIVGDNHIVSNMLTDIRNLIDKRKRLLQLFKSLGDEVENFEPSGEQLQAA